ncbi:hypothetical protein FRB95_011495 [Tulasnella sp. JGI-2019a]|nr:hypothetical protein FRB93_012925 [Tulasnella sp. JGI-2019a]KAG9035344.1 hypothetical protein FRB95_011495 [Tulasnella sp. JGI-2019a]
MSKHSGHNPDVKAIICTIGGHTTNELLPHLDYELIRANPKIFIGYSDITLLHYALFVKAGLRTFYGPAVITQWGEFPQPYTFTADHFFRVVTRPVESISLVPRSCEWTQEFLDWGTTDAEQRPRKMLQSPKWK